MDLTRAVAALAPYVRKLRRFLHGAKSGGFVQPHDVTSYAFGISPVAFIDQRSLGMGVT